MTPKSCEEFKYLISVIVPVYNSESTLSRCLDSIVSQTYKNIEIILINDGSTDKSLDICEKYKRNDSRIIAINKVNAGVSAARNSGLEVAKGDYIAFVDSDDYIDVDMYNKLVIASDNGDKDIVFCGYNVVKNDEITPLVEPKLKDAVVNRQFQYLLLPEYNVMGVVWRSLFSKGIISDVKFDAEIGVAEDLLFTITCLAKTTKVSVIDDKCYFYHCAVGKYIDNKFINQLLKLEREIKNILLNLELKDLAAANCFYKYYSLWELWLYSYSKDNNLKSLLKANADLKSYNSKDNYKCFKIYIQSIKKRIIAALLHYKMYNILKLILNINKKVKKL